MRSLTPLILTLLLISCGKDNTVDTSKLGSSTTVTSVTQQEMATFHSKYPCSMGNRLADMSFYTTQYQLYGNTLYGEFASGRTSNGNPSARFVGFSNFNDIMILEKISNGSSVTGYNVTLSFCEFSNLLVPDRSYRNFIAPNGITISDNLNCSYGSILSALTYIDADYYKGADPTKIDTIFTIPTGSACAF